MRTEQPTECLYDISYGGCGCARKTSLSPPSNSLLTVQGGGSGVVSVSCFGVRVSVRLHFMFLHYIFSSVLVAEWPPFGK